MRMRPLLPWCLLSLLAAAPAQAGRQEGGQPPGEPPAKVVCRVCRDDGNQACSKHGKLLALEQAPAVQHCSVVAECKTCGGALAVDCKTCDNPGSDAMLAQRRELAAQWLKKRRETIDALSTKREPYLHISTTNVDLALNLKAVMVGKEKVEPHQRLHIFADRIEKLRSLFLETLELQESEMPHRLLVVMSEEQKDHSLIAPRITGLGNADSIGLKLMGPEFVYSMYQERRSMPDDEAVHRNIIHAVTHLLSSQMPPMLRLGNKGHGWIDEGLSHRFEDKILGRCTNFCYEEIRLAAGAGFKGGKWRPAVRKLADEGKLPIFASFSGKQTDELSFPEHATSFALIDFLIASRGGGKLRDLLRLVKDSVETRDAINRVYGLTPLSIDAVFVEWVKANYSPLQPQ